MNAINGKPIVPASLIPDDAPFSPEQRAWLSGFLMALLSSPGVAATQPQAPAVKTKLDVLYASQTGTAEGLARKFARAAKERNLDATVRDIGSLALADLAALKKVVIVAATHGEGDPPDSTLVLTQALKDASGTPLAGLDYIVLALGDSSYVKFCAYGTFLDERLAALGATRLAERVNCDGDPSRIFTGWRDKSLPLFADSAAVEPQIASVVANEDETDPVGSRANPFAAELIDNRRITGITSDKEVRHIAFSLAGSPMAYEPGDAVGVVVENATREVDAVLAAASLDGAAEIELEGNPMRLTDALRAELSVGRLTQASVIKFAKLSKDPELLSLIEPERGQDLAAFVHGRDLIDLLLNYPGVVTSPAMLASLLPRLQPRLYSISSSPKAHPGEVHLTVATVRYESHGRKRDGIASGYLASLDPGARVRIYTQPNKRFRLPKDGDTPVIMIGPGTGIAPFRAFLEERRASGAKGSNWLFFGDRRAATDFLYKEELGSFSMDGTLTRLDTAFSRDQAEKVYVQTRMLEQAEELGKWLADGAHVYVCGDAQHMAKDVDRALRTIVARHGKLSDAQAQIQVNQMAAEGRYLRDVY